MTQYVTVLLFLFCSARADELDISGQWEGAVSRLGAVQIIRVDLVQNGNGYSGTIDIPERARLGEKLDSVSFQNNQLTFRFFYGTFRLQYDWEYEEFTGLNDKWEPDVQIHLKRALPPVKTYRSEEISFISDGVTLSGTLFLPLISTPAPALVFLHGSETNNRSHSIYASNGPIFAGQGYAGLLYDRRGTGRSGGGNPDDVSFREMRDDALAAVNFLKSRKEIDTSRIGLKGPSQGGWIAPMAAAETKSISFLLLTSAPSVGVQEQERQRVEYSLRQNEFDSAAIAEALAYVDLQFHTTNTGQDWDRLAALIEASRDKPWAEYFQFPVKLSDLGWWRDNEFDPGQYLTKVSCPVLVIYGEIDPLVPPAENAEAMGKLLRQGGNKNVQIEILPKADHGLDVWQTLRGDGNWEWPNSYWIWMKKHPDYFPMIFTWLDKTTHRN